MLNIMRRGANSWIIKVLLVFIALSFVVWGVGDDLGRKIQLPVAETPNWSISPREFSTAYDTEFQRLRQRFGGSLDKKTAESLGLKQRTLTALINSHLIKEASRNMRLTVSQEELRRQIASNPAFITDGKFDKARYELLLRNNRLTPKEYEAQLANDLLNNQLQQAVGHFSVVPDILVKDSFELEQEARQVTTLHLNPKDLEDRFNPEDKVLQEYLDEHIDRFLTKAQVKVRHVMLNTDSVREGITVTPEELREYYDEHIDNYIQPETREARHILVKVEGEVDDAAALAKIQKAASRMKSGEAFADIAKEFSDDISASSGGSLGEFGRGMMVKPFEDATFALAEDELSQPVKTKFGYHIIMVDKINAGKTKSLEEVKNKIEPLLKEAKAANMVYDRSIAMEDQLFASGDLKGVSGDLNLRYTETDFFARSDYDKLKGIEKENKFLDAAFSTPKGDISPVIELTNNRFFALEVLGKKEPKPQTLTEAREAILKAYRRDQSKKLAKELMEQAQKSLAAGKDWKTVAAMDSAMKTVQLKPFNRAGTGGVPSPAVRTAAFQLTMEKPDHPEALNESGGFTLIRLQKIIPADPTQYEVIAKELRPQLQQSLGFEQVSSYLIGLRQKAKIRVNQSVLDLF